MFSDYPPKLQYEPVTEELLRSGGSPRPRWDWVQGGEAERVTLVIHYIVEELRGVWSNSRASGTDQLTC